MVYYASVNSHINLVDYSVAQKETFKFFLIRMAHEGPQQGIGKGLFIVRHFKAVIVQPLAKSKGSLWVGHSQIAPLDSVLTGPIKG